MSLPPRPPRRIRLLHVHVDDAGRLSPYHPARYNDPAWWDNVLQDPRARVRRDRIEDILGRHLGEELIISCTKCPRGRRHRIDDLIVKFGSGCSCYQAAARLLDDAATCRHGRDCGLHYETTSSFERPGR